MPVAATIDALLYVKQWGMPMLGNAVTELRLLKASAPSRHLHNDSWDVFIAAPMSGYNSDEKYKETRGLVMRLIAELEEFRPGSRIYFAGSGLPKKAHFSDHELALKADLKALHSARVFILVYPQKVLSSVLVEAGYAFALRIPTIILVRSRTDLPYLFQEAEQLVGSLLVPEYIAIHEFNTESDMANMARQSIDAIRNA